MRALFNPESPSVRSISALFGLVVVLCLSGADEPAVVPSDPSLTAHKIDGSTITGRLRQIDIKAGVTLVNDKDKSTTIATSSLVKLVREGSTPLSSTAGSIILFPDGDRLYRSVIEPAGDTSIVVQSFSLGTVSVPVESVLALVFAPPTETDAIHALCSKLRDDPRTTEVLYLLNGDRIAGGLLALDEKKIAFQPIGAKIEIDRSSVLALGFDPKLVNYPQPQGPFLEVTFVDGSRLGVTSVHIEEGQLIGMSRFGQNIKLPLAELAQIHTKNDSVIYLSDRVPTLTRYISYLGPTRPVRVNQSIDAQALRLGGKIYDRGLGTQSRSYLAYRLEPGIKKFQAIVGVDDRAGPLGSVIFRVVVDGKEKYTTLTMTVRDTPKFVDIDLNGASTIVLITDFGERGEVRDHADWAEARLIR